MADQPRRVIYLSPSGPEIKEITETYHSSGSQSLVQVEYSGVNPADLKHAFLGWHSSVAGYEFAGEVIAVGPDSPFKVGDKVFGHNPAGPNRPLCFGAHQDFAIANSQTFWPVPTPRMSLREAAVLPVVTGTAADGLFNVLNLAFPSAGLEGSKEQSILIWGAASAVGVAAIQLAKAAGHGPLIVTASAKHHATLKSLGADVCFDYHDEDVVEKVRDAIDGSGKSCKRVFDTVGAGSFAQGEELERSSPALAAKVFDVNAAGQKEMRFACVLPVPKDERWVLCSAVRPADLLGAPPGPKEWKFRLSDVVNWAIANYGEGTFKFPNVRTVRGIRQGIEALQWSAAGRCSLEKIVIEHPFLEPSG